MNLYIYNPLKAPQIIGSMTIPAGAYTVVDEEAAGVLRASGAEVIVEGDGNFVPLFVRNIPARTPDQIA